MDRLTEPPIASSEAAAPTPPATPPEPVQRWRITFARGPVPSDAVGRTGIDAWQAALAQSGLVIATLGAGDRPRARLSIAAPLAAAWSGRAELAEIWLLERVPAWAVREALEGRLPPAHRWVSAEDVWLGAPPLPGQVVAADWTVALARGSLDPADLAAASRSLLRAPSLPRVRAKAGAERAYDLRPLLGDVRVAGEHDGRVRLAITTRFDPALGSGRPEEVVAALSDVAGLDSPPAIDSIVRERLILAEPGRGGPPERTVSGPRRPRR